MPPLCGHPPKGVSLMSKLSRFTRTLVLALCMTLVSAALIPFCAFAYCTYFVIRTGGRVFLTFMMDCGIMWSIVTPITLILANFTSINIELLFLIGQAAETVKLIPGLIILTRGSWAKRLV